MQKKLIEIASIFSGQTFRGRIQNDIKGDVWVIQMKDINADYSGLVDRPHYTSRESVHEKQMLRSGDILFTAKGNVNKAYVYREDHPAVAVSLFFIIRVDQNVVVPEFISWYLNSDQIQKKLRDQQEGSSTANIKKAVLEHVEVLLPPLHKQRVVGDIQRLMSREKDIVSQLERNREQIIEQYIIKTYGK